MVEENKHNDKYDMNLVITIQTYMYRKVSDTMKLLSPEIGAFIYEEYFNLRYILIIGSVVQWRS